MKIIDVQQGSAEWHRLRVAAITGTKLNAIMSTQKRTRENILNTFVSERIDRLSNDSDFENAHMRRGKELEPAARQAWAGLRNVIPVSVGMLQSDDFEHFRISPDCVVFGPDKKIEGVAEIKCPMLRIYLERVSMDAVPRDALWQTLAPMVMDDCVRWVDYVNYVEPDTLGPRVFMKRVLRVKVEDQIKEARDKLADFFAKAHAKELEMVF